MSSSEFLTASLSPYVATADIGDDSLPLQHSLGLTWNLNTDSFIFTAPVVDNPFTRRGLLSAVSSIFPSSILRVIPIILSHTPWFFDKLSDVGAYILGI
jgi:hypothetical protein